jgi:hypothetical protein
MKAVSSRSIVIALAVSVLCWYVSLCCGCNDTSYYYQPDWSLTEWQPKYSMKYETKPCCESMTTDWEITCCTGDINPADSLEDENVYTYSDADRIN